MERSPFPVDRAAAVERNILRGVELLDLRITADEFLVPVFGRIDDCHDGPVRNVRPGLDISVPDQVQMLCPDDERFTFFVPMNRPLGRFDCVYRVRASLIKGNANTVTSTV